MNEKCLVILPTYNDAANLSPLVEEILLVGDLLGEPKIDVLIIDDHSSDDTGDLAEHLKLMHRGRVSVLHRLEHLGFGTACLIGFRYAIASGYDPVVQMDASFSQDPSLLPLLLRASRVADLVIGSRFVAGGAVRGWPTWRKWLSRAGSFYAGVILGLSASDLTSGFKCYHASTLASLDLSNIKSNGYAFQIEVTYRCALLGLRIVEVPVVFTDRGSGSIKPFGRAAAEALSTVWRLRFARYARAMPSQRLTRQATDLSYITGRRHDDVA